MSDTALTVLLLDDGTAWRCHTTTESHPDRRPCGWCVRLPDALVEPLSARYPTKQPGGHDSRAASTAPQ